MIALPPDTLPSSRFAIDLDAPPAPSRCAAVRPFLGDGTTIDVTDTVIAAIAAELGRRFGGNAVLNLIEARRLLDELLANGAAPSP